MSQMVASWRKASHSTDKMFARNGTNPSRARAQVSATSTADCVEDLANCLSAGRTSAAQFMTYLACFSNRLL